MGEVINTAAYGKTLQGWLMQLVELIAPSSCFLCRKFNYSGPDPWLCPDCERALPFIDGAQSHESQSLLLMQAGAEQLIEAFKFHGKRQLLPTLIRIIELRPDLVNFIQAADAILPVPIHKNRLRWRGFNQAQLIAKALAHRYHKPLYINSLIKIHATDPQSQLTRKKRLSNLEDSIQVNPKLLPHQKKLLLIDDVITTGATLNACKQALREALPQAQLFSFTLAKTVNDR